tara:strand:+ start:471 stop:644 length:174 start_codon:yes stop_codon:yes gene_type:complete
MDDIIKQLRDHYKDLEYISRKIVGSDMSDKDVLDVCLHIDKAQRQISLANIKITDCS